MPKVVFKRDGSVQVDGVKVGTFRRPDPSGPAWANARRWVFEADDGAVELGINRASLIDYATSAACRLAAKFQ